MEIKCIREGVQVLQRDLMHYRVEIGHARPDFESRIGQYLSPSRPFDVKEMRSDAAFKRDAEGFVAFNANAFSAFHRPIDEAERLGLIPPAAAESARQMAIEQLVVHEMAHVGIGLVNFEDVQFFKSTAGADALGEIDVAADGTAAHICALLEVCRAQDHRPLAVVHRLIEQLFLMGRFAFPAFRSPADKPHKRRRFLGLAMMTARALQCVETGILPDVAKGALPLEASIYPYTHDKGAMLICAFNPDRIVWGRKAVVDSELLETTLNELDTAKFEISVERASRLLRQAGALVIPPAAKESSATVEKTPLRASRLSTFLS